MYKKLLILLIVFAFLNMPSFASASQFPTIAGCTITGIPYTPKTNDQSMNDLGALIVCLAGKISSLQNTVAKLEGRIATLEGIKTGDSAQMPSPDTNYPVPAGQGGTLPAGMCKRDNNNWICTGEKGDDIHITTDQVKVIQGFLKAEGSFTFPSQTGYYGNYTKQAVKNFQTKNSLPVSGIINQATLNKMEILAPQISPSLQTSIHQIIINQ